MMVLAKDRRWQIPAALFVGAISWQLLAIVKAGPAVAADLGLSVAASPGGPATDSLTLRISLEGPTPGLEFFLSQSGDKPLEGVTLASTPIVDDTGDQSNASLEFEPSGAFTVPASPGEVPVTGTVKNLTTLGTFTTKIFARQNLTFQTLATLTLQRTRVTPSVQVQDVPTARVTLPFPGVHRDVEVLVTFTNSGTRDISLAGVALAKYTVASGSDTFQAKLPLVAAGSAAKGSMESGEPKEASELLSVVVPAGGQSTVIVTLRDIGSAGAYSGTLSFTGPAIQPIQKDFALKVRESAILPALLIALGVGLSFIIREIAGAGRTKLVQQRRARQLQRDIGQIYDEIHDLRPWEREVVEALDRQLDDLFENIELNTAVKPDEAMDMVDNKLALFPFFVTRRRQVEAIQRMHLQRKYLDQLRGAEVAGVFKARTATAADLGELRKRLEKMAEEIANGVRDDLKARITAFEKEVNTWTKDLPNLSITVVPKLALAATHADGGQVPVATEEFDSARLEYAKALAAKLLADLRAAGDTPPPGLEQSEWQRLRDQVTAGAAAVLDAKVADDATAGYRGAARSYLESLARGLLSATMKEIERSKDKRKAALEAALEKAKNAIDQVDRDLRQAREFYRAALDAYQLAMKVPVDEQTDEAIAAAADEQLAVLTVASELAEVGGVPPAAGQTYAEVARNREVRGRIALDRLTARLRTRQIVFTVIVGLVALALGLLFLWWNDATWGGFGSWALAFLWGLGIHQTAGATFDVTALGKALAEGEARTAR